MKSNSRGKKASLLLGDLSGGLSGGAIDRLVIVLLVVQELLFVDVVLLGLSHPGAQEAEGEPSAPQTLEARIWRFTIEIQTSATGGTKGESTTHMYGSVERSG